MARLEVETVGLKRSMRRESIRGPRVEERSEQHQRKGGQSKISTKTSRRNVSPQTRSNTF